MHNLRLSGLVKSRHLLTVQILTVLSVLSAGVSVLWFRPSWDKSEYVCRVRTTSALRIHF